MVFQFGEAESDWIAAGWKVDLDVLGTNNTFTKQARQLIVQLLDMRSPSVRASSIYASLQGATRGCGVAAEAHALGGGGGRSGLTLN